MNLQEIAKQAESAIDSIQEAQRLLETTYGAGCSNNCAHNDRDEIKRAARTLIVHLSWLKARAVALTLIQEAGEDAKKKFVNLVR